MEQAHHVSINVDNLRALAKQLVESGRLGGEGVSWEEDGWHYQDDVSSSGPLTCQYIMVVDTLNFCFWPSAGES